MKIGVLADTHVPDRRKRLPPRVLELFASVEIVLHAGDITQVSVLHQLQESVSLTFAVFGDKDPPNVRSLLQETQVLELQGRRIGLVHGARGLRQEVEVGIRSAFRASPYTPEYIDYLMGRFNHVDAIVFGHTHLPYAKVHQGVFFFNPGSLVPRSGNPTVGLLEIDARGISGRILNL